MCGSFTNNYAAWCHFQSTELPNVSQGKMETRSRCGGIFAASQGKVATYSRCGGIFDVSQGKVATGSTCGGVFAALQGKVATRSRCGGISDDVHTCDYLESMTEDAQ